MKRKAICFFVLIAWGLVICTIFSVCIEQQMTVQVAAVTSDGFSETKLSASALFQDDTGTHLYQVVKGDGWESGYRAQEISPYDYWMEEDGIFLTYGSEYGFIQYASKSVTQGDLLQLVHQYKGKEGCYLVVESEEMKAALSGTGIEVAEKNGKSMLLSMTAEQPYMESQVKDKLTLPEDSRVYSLEEVNDFFRNVPLVAVLIVIVIVSVVLWGYSCVLCNRRRKLHKLSVEVRKIRLLILVNTGIAAVLLGIFQRVTQAIELPSSLLPEKNILDMKYYMAEFSEIIETLKNFSSAAARETVRAFQWNMMLAGGVILVGAVCGIGILRTERLRKSVGGKK